MKAIHCLDCNVTMWLKKRQHKLNLFTLAGLGSAFAVIDFKVGQKNY